MLAWHQFHHLSSNALRLYLPLIPSLHLLLCVIRWLYPRDPKDEVDIYFARQLVNEKLKEATEKIPKGIGTPELAPVSTGLGEVYQYIIHPKKGSEAKYNPKDLRTMQDWIVARQLNGTPGIAEVNSFGGELKQYEVAVNPNRLKAMGVSIPDIFNALEANNQNTGGAYIEKGPSVLFIRSEGLIQTLEDIQTILEMIFFLQFFQISQSLILLDNLQ